MFLLVFSTLQRCSSINILLITWFSEQPLKMCVSVFKGWFDVMLWLSCWWAHGYWSVRTPAGRDFDPSLLLRSICFFATLPFVFFFVFFYHCNWIIWLAKNWNVHSQWNSYPSLWTHSWSWLRHTHWSVLEHNLVWVVMYEISRGSLLRLSVFMTLCVGMQIPFQIRFHFCSRLDKQHKWVTWVLIWSDH